MIRGKVVIVEPGAEPRLENHIGVVKLENLHRWLGYVTVDCVGLGTIPPKGRKADMWIDDEGLLNDSKPNRRLPNGTVICGTLLVCTSDEVGNSLPFSDEEAAFVAADVVKRWPKMLADEPKPEPHWSVTRVG